MSCSDVGICSRVLGLPCPAKRGSPSDIIGFRISGFRLRGVLGFRDFGVRGFWDLSKGLGENP